ncbi:hypothetical protein [Paenibacillus kribbensis]|uniref:hypothetical protein n=1 Tax=Paenibacillus kribbensis TaxID=172713 RepID=UPI0008385693|nr:hypothetical protein [Paenibacillus kribbensis]
MAQALIQQRFYVGAKRRFYEYDIVMALKSSKLQFYMQLTGAAAPYMPQTIPARGRSSARHAAEHSGFACCAHVLRLRTFVVAQGFAP